MNTSPLNTTNQDIAYLKGPDEAKNTTAARLISTNSPNSQEVNSKMKKEYSGRHNTEKVPKKIVINQDIYQQQSEGTISRTQGREFEKEKLTCSQFSSQIKSS